MAIGLDALALLRKDHERVEQLFRRFDRTRGEEDQTGLIEEVCAALSEHAELEEQYFYPVVRDITGDEQLVEEAQIEHASVRRLIDMLQGGPGGPRELAAFRVLMEYVRHHVQEEEERIFPLVRKTGIDLEAFGEELAERKGELQARGRKASAQPEHAARTRRAAREDREAETRMPGDTEPPVGEKRTSAQRAAELRRGGAQKRGGNGEGSESHGEPAQVDNTVYQEAHKDGLSKTTLRAKWVNSPEEHEDRPGQSLATRSHDVIRRWAEERRAAPATTPGGDMQRPRALRFNFAGYDKDLQEVSWEAWFGTFDERDLVFVFQEHMKAGNLSNFFKFDSPEREHE